MIRLVVDVLLIVYAVGVVIGFAGTDDRWPVRLIVALCWPLGPLAFAIVITILVLVAAVLWPLIVVPVLAAGAALVYYLT